MRSLPINSARLAIERRVTRTLNPMATSTNMMKLATSSATLTLSVPTGERNMKSNVKAPTTATGRPIRQLDSTLVAVTGTKSTRAGTSAGKVSKPTFITSAARATPAVPATRHDGCHDMVRGLPACIGPVWRWAG